MSSFNLILGYYFIFQVDDNVTRHLENELKPTADWDVMILHYLGLDHIGHLGGPRSTLMPNKLLEMDNIIKRIVNYLVKFCFIKYSPKIEKYKHNFIKQFI